MNDPLLDTVRFDIEEIQGEKVKPVEAQIFETGKRRVRLTIMIVSWLIALLLLLFVALAVSGLVGALAVVNNLTWLP